MTGDDQRSVIFLAFANDRGDGGRYLRNLPEELRRVREELEKPKPERVCEVVVRSNITTAELLDVFRDPRYRGRIAVFHFGGHASGGRLVTERPEGRPDLTHAEGLADFLGHQQGLQLVFLNACFTQPQVDGLLRAGLPAVIATSEAIDDSAATELSAAFYAALAGGDTIETAFSEAVAAVKTVKGDSPRDAYREGEASSDRWAWEIRFREGANAVRGWSLPKAAKDPLFGLPPLPERNLPRTPYRQLQSFRPEDAEIFFGRGQDIRELYERVAPRSAAPIVLFYGQSGVGKSSLLAAGLLPRLASSFHVRYARRQRELGLTGTLAAVLEAHDPQASLTAAWHAVESQVRRPLVVILDQLDEAYARPRPDDPAELEQFLALVVQAFAEHSLRPNGKLVLAFREERLAYIDDFLKRKNAFCSGYRLKRLDHAGVIEIVRGPISSPRLRRHFGLQIDPGLAELIAHDLLQDPEAPAAPTLEILLTKMWRQAKGGSSNAPEFTIALYQALRRKGLLLGDFVDEQLATLREWNQQVVDTGLALDVLTFHTTPEGTAEVRTRNDLDRMYSHQSAMLPGLLQQSKDLNLLVDHTSVEESENERAEGTRLAHDTLAPLLQRRLKDSDKPGQRARRILESRKNDWRDGRTGTPLDSADLATVEQGQAGMPTWSADEQRLVRTSRLQRRNRRWAIRAVGAVGMIAVAVIIWLYVTARASETKALSRALAATARNEPQLDLALLLGIEALRVNATSEARDVLVDTPRRATPRLLTTLSADTGADASGIAAFSPDGRSLATGSEDGTISVWDVDSRQVSWQPVERHLGGARALSFSPDGNTLASGGYDSIIRLWNVKAREPAGHVPAGDGEFPIQWTFSVAFSPDGKLLASGSEDGVRVWRVPTRQLVWRTSVDTSTERSLGDLFADLTLVVAFSPDNTTLAAGEYGRIRLFNAKTGRPIVEPLRGGPGVAFSPNRKTLAYGDTNGAVNLWDMTKRASSEPPFPGKSKVVSSLAFSPDGQTLASSHDAELTIQLLDVEKHTLIGQPLTGGGTVAFSRDGALLASAGTQLWEVRMHNSVPTASAEDSNEILTVAFAPDGNSLASGSRQGIRLWDVKTRRPVGQPLKGQAVDHLVFSPDGRTLAFGTGGDSIGLWDVLTRKAIGEPVIRAGRQDPLAFSPDGQTLITSNWRGEVQHWNAKTGQAKRSESFTDSDGFRNGAMVRGVGLSPDGNIMAVLVTYDSTAARMRNYTGPIASNTIRLWDVRRMRVIGHAPATQQPRYEKVAMAVSPDGKTVAWSVDESFIRLSDATAHRPRWVLTAGQRDAGQDLTSKVRSLAFSWDGKTLASGNDQGTIRLWDVQTRQPVGQPLRGHTGAINTLLFSPDGRNLASGSGDGTVRLWEANDSAWIDRSCLLAGRNLSLFEWGRFLPDDGYRCTCSSLPPGLGVRACPS
jgi:WD40 repeat protein